MAWVGWTRGRCEGGGDERGASVASGDREALTRHLEARPPLAGGRGEAPVSVLWIHLREPAADDQLGPLLDILGVPAPLRQRIVSGESRAQVDEEEGCLFVRLQVAQATDDGETFASTLRLVVLRECLISVEAARLEPAETLRADLVAGNEGLHHPTADFLLWLLLDRVLARSCEFIEARLDAMERFEETLMERQARDDLVALRGHRQAAAELRRALMPLDDLSARLLHRDDASVRRTTRAHFRDLHAHAQHAARRAAALGQASTDLLALYLSISNTRMQAVVRMLTGVATLFLPLSFVTGVYGMNFRFMPELSWRWSYPVLMACLLLGGLGLFFTFRRKDWL